MRTIEWQNGKIITLDQTRLPHEIVTVEISTVDEAAEAIRHMKIRGAPLIGATAAFTLALAAYHSHAKKREDMIRELEQTAAILRKTRPTAVNLSWAADRILRKARESPGDPRHLRSSIIEEAQSIADEDISANRSIGRHGAHLIKDGDVILTHCNAGALATVGYGTALGVVRAAWEQGKRIKVIATETRPKLQGARLTAYELKREEIPVTLITDSMAGYIMYRKLVHKVIVGADRVVKDAVINKIGTYTIAALARRHGIPFYVAAPKSTFDLIHSASEVIIEDRQAEEVTHLGSFRIAPEGVEALNPAFDITPFEYVAAVISEDGVLTREDLIRLPDQQDRQHEGLIEDEQD